jgi:hypothetical protein
MLEISARKRPSWSQKAPYAICGENKEIDKEELEHIDNIVKSKSRELDRLSISQKGEKI